jgi:hypothetical protein
MHFKFLFLFLFLFINCKKVTNKHLFVTIEVQAKLSDDIQLFFQNNYLDNYSEKMSFKSSIKGDLRLNKIVFKVPFDKTNRIRIDLGNNKLQECVYIRGIYIGLDSLHLKKINIKDNFLFNNCSITSTNGEVILNKNKALYDPYIVSKNINLLLYQ